MIFRVKINRYLYDRKNNEVWKITKFDYSTVTLEDRYKKEVIEPREEMDNKYYSKPVQSWY